MGSIGRRAAVVLAAVVLCGLVTTTGAVSQKAVVSCPGAFEGKPFISGPDARLVDGIARAGCRYGNGGIAEYDFLLSWREQDSKTDAEYLCGVPRHRFNIGADVDTTRGVRGDEQHRIAAHLTPDDELLLVATGQRPRGGVDRRGAHVVPLDDPGADRWQPAEVHRRA